MSVNRPSGYVAAQAATAMPTFQMPTSLALPGAAQGLLMQQQPVLAGSLAGLPSFAAVGMLQPQQPVPGLAVPLPQQMYGGAPAMGLAFGSAEVPTSCLCVAGMIGADNLMSDFEYNDVRG